MIKLRSFPLCVLASVFAFSAFAAAQQAPTVRIVDRIDESNLVTLKGNTHPAANPKNDRGRVNDSFALPDLTLVLSRSPEQQAAFEAFIASQYESGSANYHQWLTPAQIGAQFGPAQADIATITGWLAGYGFTVKNVAPDGMTIHFAGNAAQVQSAFHTEIHNLSVNGAPRYANMSDPQIPAALAPVVVGVKRLNSFLPQPQHKLGSLVQFNKQAGKWQRVTSTGANGSSLAAPVASAATPGSAFKPALKPHTLYGENGCIGTSCDTAEYLEEDLTPYDFATIYNVTPAWNAGYTGTGQTVAIAGTSFINLGTNSNPNKNSSSNDVATYRSAFGLPAGLAPNEIDAGSYFNTGTTATICASTSSSAACNEGDLVENSLDVEMSGAAAPSAQIDLVVTGQSSACNTTTGSGCIDTLYDSAAYVVDNVTAKILSLSYGECELGNGTAENVAYYNLWSSAAAEGISVIVATDDSGSPACDDDFDEFYGNPYVAQYGLSVNGIASTPYNTAVGGTDFSWCQPYYNSSGDYEGCADSSTTQTSNGETTAYWSTSNNGTTGASALGYVPEIPWNDTCENPILAREIQTELSLSFPSDSIPSADSYYGFNPTTPEATCSAIYANYYNAGPSGDLDAFFEYYYSFDPYFEDYVDAVGGGGGVSSCVVNNTSASSNPYGACTAGSTSTGATTNPDTGANQLSINVVNNGWPVPSWQSGVTGTSGLTNRALPDVSFFAGNGALGSATLVCVSNLGACTYNASVTSTTQLDENTAQEIGGTSVAAPEMAGIMALIDQKAGGAQGLANKELYQLAGAQTYSSCSAELGTSLSSSSTCYFQDIDNGPTAQSGAPYTNAQTNAMPCNLTATPEGAGESTGVASPNCVALNSGDVIGTLVSSGTTPGYNSTTGYDLATGLGSMNVYNVVRAWVSDAGTGSTTMTVTPTPSAITINQAISVVVSVTGTGTTPTGTITLTGDGYSATETIGTSPCTSNTSCTFTIAANTLAAGSGITFTAYYNGDSNYAQNSKATTITVNVMTPTVTVTAPASENVANATTVNVTVAAPSGAIATPTGTVYLKSGSYTSATVALSGGSTTFLIPANSLAVGGDTITAYYSGDVNFGGNTGQTPITITQTVQLTPVVTVTPSPTSIDTGQSLGVTVSVTGSGAAPTGSIYLTSGSYSSQTTPETIGTTPCTSNTSCSFTIPANKLSAGTDSITAHYSGDTNYTAATGMSATGVTVTQSAYALSATTPTAVTPPGTTTSTISGSQSITDYTGTVTLSTCSLTTPPPGAVEDATCTVSGTITYANGTPTGTGTATITTYSVTTGAMTRPKFGNGKGWLGAGSGAVLALLMFFGIPARRRSWRSMLSVLIAMAALGALVSCGGGSSGGSSGGGGTTTTLTTPGSYVFTVTGTGNDPNNTPANATFTVTVNQ